MTLQQLLSQPEYADLADDEAAKLASTPVYTPRAGRVTFATLTATDVWGFGKATAFMAALRAAANPTTQAVLALLNGPGFDPTDPQASAVAGQLATAFSSVITADDARLALNTISYPAGSVVTAEQVAAARAIDARESAITSLKADAHNLLTTLLSRIQQVADGSDSVPTLAGLVAEVLG